MTHPRVLAALLTLPLAACVADGQDANVVIIQNNAPSANCVVPAGLEAGFLSTGRIDATSSTGYLLTPVVKNFATATTVEQQRIAFVEGMLVDVAFGDADLFDSAELSAMRDSGLTRFDAPLSGIITPGGTTSFVVDVLPGSLLAAMKAKLPEDAETIALVNVRAYGHMGGSDFESQAFRYPVTVCNGCLANDVGACSALSPGFQPRLGGACNTLQDAVADCCTIGETPVCPAVPPSE